MLLWPQTSWVIYFSLVIHMLKRKSIAVILRNLYAFKRAYSGSKVSSKKALNPLSCSFELVSELYLKLNTSSILYGNCFEIKQKFEKRLLTTSESVRHMKYASQMPGELIIIIVNIYIFSLLHLD